MRLVAYGLGLGLSLVVLFLPVRNVLLSEQPGPPAEKATSATADTWRPTPSQLDGARTALAKKRAKLEREGPKRFDQPQEAWEFFVGQRLPLGEDELPIDYLRAELTKLNEREAAQAMERGPRSPTCCARLTAETTGSRSTESKRPGCPTSPRTGSPSAPAIHSNSTSEQSWASSPAATADRPGIRPTTVWLTPSSRRSTSRTTIRW